MRVKRAEKNVYVVTWRDAPAMFEVSAGAG